MNMLDFHEKPGSAVYDWRPELASTITTRLYEQHPVLHRHCGRKEHMRARQAVESLLAHLSTAMRLEQPKSFADVVAHGDALSVITSLSMVDRGTALRQIHNTVKGSLPGLRG